MIYEDEDYTPTTNTTPLPWRTTPAREAQRAAARMAARAATQMAERKAQFLGHPTRFELELPDSIRISVTFTQDCRSPALLDAMSITKLIARNCLGMEEESPT